MTSSQLLSEALQLAERQGFHLRHDHLGGAGSGFYQLRETWWLVIDLAQPVDEQLRQVAEAIKSRPIPPEATISPELAQLLEVP